jgi:hypothetical protein
MISEATGCLSPLAEESFRVTRTFRIATEAEAWLMSQKSLAKHKLADES